MRREVWRLMRESKRFYVNTYRFVERSLVFSLALNIILVFGLFYAYFATPSRHYYATNGAVPPIELTPRDAPNETATPWLSEQPETEDDEKEIPT